MRRFHLSDVPRLLTRATSAIPAECCPDVESCVAGGTLLLEQAGIDSTSQGNNSSWVAGVLQIVPGIGNFYLAAGTEEHPQIWYGVLNIIPGWLVWPIGRTPRFCPAWTVLSSGTAVRKQPKRSTAR